MRFSLIRLMDYLQTISNFLLDDAAHLLQNFVYLFLGKNKFFLTI